MNDENFDSFLTYVLEDAAIRGVKRARASLPPSWTSEKLRKIEVISQRPTTVLTGTLFENYDERFWRRYAPVISIFENDALNAAEQKLSNAIYDLAVSKTNNGTETEIEAAAVRYRPLVNRVQAVYSRGAAPLTPNTFFRALRRALDTKIVGEEVIFPIACTSAFLFATQLALTFWCRDKKTDTRSLWVRDYDTNEMQAIKRLAGFQHGALPTICEETVRRHFQDAVALLGSVDIDRAKIVAFQSTQFAARDQPGADLAPPRAPIIFGEDDLKVFDPLFNDDMGL